MGSLPAGGPRAQEAVPGAWEELRSKGRCEEGQQGKGTQR